MVQSSNTVFLAFFSTRGRKVNTIFMFIDSLVPLAVAGMTTYSHLGRVDKLLLLISEQLSLVSGSC